MTVGATLPFLLADTEEPSEWDGCVGDTLPFPLGGVTVAPPPSTGWTTVAVPPRRKDGPGWSTTPITPPLQYHSSWFALLERPAALRGDGTLTAGVAPYYPHSGPAFHGSGGLTAANAPHYRLTTTAFSGAGAASGTAAGTRAILAAFIGGGVLHTVVNDGLSAIVTPGPYSLAATLGGSGTLIGIVGSDGLSAVVGIPGEVAIPFSGTGTLSVEVGYFDGLSAEAHRVGGQVGDTLPFPLADAEGA
jgi:hypothetical protein